MKKIIVMLLFISYNGFCQLETDSINNTYYFKKIDSVAKSKAEIKTSTKVWFAKTFKDSKSVIRLNGDNQIIGKGNFDINHTSSGYPFTSTVDFTITVSFKEGRYRFQMDNFSITVAKTTNPLEFYILNSTFEGFKKRMFQYVQTMPEEQKKSTLRFYKKEKNLKKGFEASKEVSNSIINSTNKEIIFIYNSFQNSIKTKKDDW